MPILRRLVSHSSLILLWLGTLALYLVTSAAILDNPDGRSAYSMTRGLVLRGNLSIEPQAQLDEMFEQAGRDGAIYSKYGLVQPLLQVPLFLAGQWLAAGDPLSATQHAVALLHAFTTATSLVVLQSLARSLFGSPRIGTAIALIYGLATMAWLYATLTYSEPLLTLVVLLICRVLLAAERHPSARPVLLAVAGTLSGLGILTKYPAVIYMPALLWYVWSMEMAGKAAPANRRRRASWRSLLPLAPFVAPLILGVLTLAGYNLWRYGDLLNTGYHIKELTRLPRPPWYGLYTLFFSPGKSILLYAPPLIPAMLALPGFVRRTGAFGRMVIALLITSVLFYGIVRPWSGAWSPGPRYQLPMLPLALLALGLIFERWNTLATWKQLGVFGAIAAGVLVQIPLVLTSYNDTLVLLQVVTGGQYAWGFWFFDPDYMPLSWQLQILASALSRWMGAPSRLPSPLPFSVDRPGEPIDQLVCWFAHLPAGSPWLLVALSLGLLAVICLGHLLLRNLTLSDGSGALYSRRASHATLDGRNG